MDKRPEVTITLDFPVQLADRKLTDVTMRRPVMRDLLKHNIRADSGLEQDLSLIADLCGLTRNEIELFDTCDYEKLQTQLLTFRGVQNNK